MERIQENFDVFDFRLTDTEVQELNALDVKFKVVNPPWRKWPEQAH